MSDVNLVEVFVDPTGPEIIEVMSPGPPGVQGPAGSGGLSPIAPNTLLGNNTGNTAIPSGLTDTQIKTLLGLATSDSPTFTGLLFTGTDTPGLQLKSLTTAQINTLASASALPVGSILVDSTTDRIDARLARGTVELIDSAGGQVIAGNLAATTLMVGGASGPLLRNNGGTIGARTNNNGADAPIACSNLTASGNVTASANGAASTPATYLTGTWFSGGTSITNKPQLLIEPTGTTSTAWNTNGTAIGVNAASGFQGALADLKVNNQTLFSVNYQGVVTGSGFTCASGWVYATVGNAFYDSSGTLQRFRIGGTTYFTIATTGVDVTGNLTASGNVTASGIIASGGGTTQIVSQGIRRRDGNTNFLIWGGGAIATGTFSSITLSPLADGVWTQASGTLSAVSITPSYNQVASTASNTDFLINRTETSVGSGTQLFADFQVGGSSRFRVSNAGAVVIGSGTLVTSILSATATLDFPSISSNDTHTLTITVTGAVAGDSVFLGVPAALDAGLIFCASVTAANTVTVRMHNSSGGSVDPASGTFRATVIRF